MRPLAALLSVAFFACAPTIMTGRVTVPDRCQNERECSEVYDAAAKKLRECMREYDNCVQQREDLEAAKKIRNQFLAKIAQEKKEKERQIAEEAQVKLDSETAVADASHCLRAWDLDTCNKTVKPITCIQLCGDLRKPLVANMASSAKECASRRFEKSERASCDLSRGDFTDDGWSRYQDQCQDVCNERYSDLLEKEKIDKKEKEASARAEVEKNRRAEEIRRRNEGEVLRRQMSMRRYIECGHRVACCDGTCSPSCSEERRGCCSHHGGVCFDGE